MRTIVHTSHIDHGRLAECYTEPEVYKDEPEPENPAAEAFGRMLDIVYDSHRSPEGNLAAMFAIITIIRPGVLRGKSIRQIERETGGMIKQSYVSQLASKLRKEFGLK